MVKGVCRQIILVESPEPELFDQAIFILREGAVGPAPGNCCGRRSGSPRSISGRRRERRRAGSIRVLCPGCCWGAEE